MSIVDDSSSVSVVIPTLNRADLLCRVLPSYLNSSLVREVIVVDDGGTDDTCQRIQQLARSEPRLRYLRNEQNLGLPASRNRGTLDSSGSWILESEDDLALGDGCIETLVEHGSANKADIIAGRRIWVKLGETEAESRIRADRSKSPPLNRRLLDINSHAITPTDFSLPLLNATMLIRRQVFDQVQYCPVFGGASSWREESDFQLSALEKGYRLVFCPHAVAFHYSRASQSFGPSRLRGTIVYANRIFRNNLIFLRRHRTYLRTNIPESLIAGSPLVTGVAYGLYRAAWLFAAEIIRMARARKYGAFSWK
jgi:GT2 family glycosyltransferase